MERAKVGCVHLVGAGCAEADLITMRGYELLKHCDVLIYDDLIDLELLNVIPKEAECIYMGKRSGAHSAPQGEINQKLIEKAKEGKIVVRLKGGDPFVFGRGGEEILALQEAEIPYDVTPGISSAIAIPALSGIPVTHRSVSRGVHIVTAHSADTEDGLPEEVNTLANTSDTVVLLMGLSNLSKIVERFIERARSQDTPTAVISGHTAVRGTLANIVQRVEEAEIHSPAVIVIGDTAALNFSGTIKRELDDTHVNLVGTEQITEKLARSLREEGAEVRIALQLSIEELPINIDLHQCVNEKCLLTFTSSNGVRLFFKHLNEQKIDVRKLANCRFAVIGGETGKTLEQFGIFPDICPKIYTSRALLEMLLEQANKDEKIFLLRSAQGAKLLYDGLYEHFETYDISLYRMVSSPRTLIPLSPKGQKEYLVFCSAGGVDAYFDAYKMIPGGITVVCIGEQTAGALHAHNINQYHTADKATAQSIVERIIELNCEKNEEIPQKR